jgi:hypothetical protein
MTTITNAAGTEIDFDAAVNLMDDEIREAVHDALPADATEADFFRAYCEAHRSLTCEEFEPNKRNPVW